METKREHERRTREGYFENYFKGHGIDIGCGSVDGINPLDVLTPDCDKWDIGFGNGDATLMEGVAENTYDFVYASHLLEHLYDRVTALRNWYRILKPGGHMVIAVPHRDLYERKLTLPSRGNEDHKVFFLPFYDEPPDTEGLVPLFMRAIPELTILQIKILPLPAYAIEIIGIKADIRPPLQSTGKWWQH